MFNTNRSNDEKSRSSQRGSAMIMALFVITLLATTGTALIFLGQTELQMSLTGVKTKEVFYLAEAGQENGRMTLYATNGDEDFSDDLADGLGEGAAGADGDINFDPANLRVVYDSDGNVTGLTGYGDDDPLRGLTAFGNGFFAAFLTNDPEEDVTNTVDANDLVMITGVGVGRDRSFEMVQAIVEKRLLIPTMPPATITLLGPSPDFYGGASGDHEYSGDDCQGIGGDPDLFVPIVGTIGADAEAAAEKGIVYETCKGGDSNCTDGPTYTSGEYQQAEAFADLTDPTEETVVGSDYGTIDPVWTDCNALVDLLEELREAADVYCCTARYAIPRRPIPARWTA